MQISLRGFSQKQRFPWTFPYDGANPFTGKKFKIESKETIYKLLIDIYNECNKNGFKNIGEAMYEQGLMFINMTMLVDEECQIQIKEHKFCRDFKCPPYPSLIETPAHIVDNFMVIDEEIMQYSKRDK